MMPNSHTHIYVFLSRYMAFNVDFFLLIGDECNGIIIITVFVFQYTLTKITKI